MKIDQHSWVGTTRTLFHPSIRPFSAANRGWVTWAAGCRVVQTSICLIYLWEMDYPQGVPRPDQINNPSGVFWVYLEVSCLLDVHLQLKMMIASLVFCVAGLAAAVKKTHTCESTVSRSLSSAVCWREFLLSSLMLLVYLVTKTATGACRLWGGGERDI